MAMKRCPVCGEKYSDTYKNCPFCEEDAYWDEEEPRRPAPRSSRKASHGLQYSLITPTLIVLILIMALLLVYLLYGDKIAKKIGGDDPDLPGTMDSVDPPAARQMTRMRKSLTHLLIRTLKTRMSRMLQKCRKAAGPASCRKAPTPRHRPLTAVRLPAIPVILSRQGCPLG